MCDTKPKCEIYGTYCQYIVLCVYTFIIENKPVQHMRFGACVLYKFQDKYRFLPCKKTYLKVLMFSKVISVCRFAMLSVINSLYSRIFPFLSEILVLMWDYVKRKEVLLFSHFERNGPFSISRKPETNQPLNTFCFKFGDIDLWAKLNVDSLISRENLSKKGFNP